MLLDGVPVADPFFGYIPFSALAPERLASVRVTRGGGSGPFGAGALAGTIELASTNAEALGPLSGTLLVDDRGESEASATLAAPLGAGFAVVSGRWDRGQGYYTTRSEEHTSELQSLMRISYAVFCLKKKNKTIQHIRLN